MTLLQAIILGVIQGLTEFIPISSTAHLILAEKLMGLDARLTPEQTTAFIAVIQLGTLLAVISYFMRDIIKIIVGFIRGNLATLAGQGDSWARRDARLGWLIIVGSIPIGIVGLAARKIIEGKFTKNLYIIGASMIIWAILLLIAELTTRRKKTMEDLRIGDALVVGMAQVFSLIPGSSRSGTTITGAMFAGVTREAAARFSFLLSIPAVAASGLLELKAGDSFHSWNRNRQPRRRYGRFGSRRLYQHCLPARLSAPPHDISLHWLQADCRRIDPLARLHKTADTLRDQRSLLWAASCFSRNE